MADLCMKCGHAKHQHGKFGDDHCQYRLDPDGNAAIFCECRSFKQSAPPSAAGPRREGQSEQVEEKIGELLVKYHCVNSDEAAALREMYDWATAEQRAEVERLRQERDEARENLKVLDKGTLGWRCFHCGKYFTPAQMDEAREHFGSDEAWLTFQEAERQRDQLREALQEIADMSAPLPPEAFNVTVLSHSRAIIFDIAAAALGKSGEPPAEKGE